LNYGRVSVTAVDSIEKKPIFHFKPGSSLLSVGTVGCNLDCDFCQNSLLARGNPEHMPSKFYSPNSLVREAMEKGVDGIAYTFNEPVVWAEFIVDASNLSRSKGLYSMVNTNGFISGEGREQLLSAIDVIKVDIKAFREETYRRICSAELQPVLETCMAAREKGLHLEVAYPMIPGINDSAEEMSSLFGWTIEKLGSATPLHLIRFSPSFRLSHFESESVLTMRKARSEAMKVGLKYVYFGGMISPEEQNTHCPSCGVLLVARMAEETAEKLYVKKAEMSRFCPSYSDVRIYTKDGHCPHCGEAIGIRFA
jgi:pyruvate formate lyase activating enzyme